MAESPTGIPIVDAFDDWSLYEQRKREWISAHPEANHVEYQAEMTRLAQELGV